MQVKPSEIKQFFRENPGLKSDDMSNGDIASTQLADALNAQIDDRAAMAATRARLILRFNEGLRAKLEVGSVSNVEVAEALRSSDLLAAEILRLVTGE